MSEEDKLPIASTRYYRIKFNRDFWSFPATRQGLYGPAAVLDKLVKEGISPKDAEDFCANPFACFYGDATKRAITDRALAILEITRTEVELSLVNSPKHDSYWQRNERNLSLAYVFREIFGGKDADVTRVAQLLQIDTTTAQNILGGHYVISRQMVKNKGLREIWERHYTENWNLWRHEFEYRLDLEDPLKELPVGSEPWRKQASILVRSIRDSFHISGAEATTPRSPHVLKNPSIWDRIAAEDSKLSITTVRSAARCLCERYDLPYYATGPERAALMYIGLPPLMLLDKNKR